MLMIERAKLGLNSPRTVSCGHERVKFPILLSFTRGNWCSVFSENETHNPVPVTGSCRENHLK
jgi:hypothetical protein